VTVVVEGLSELNGAFAKMGRSIAADWRANERAIAEPVRRDAQELASSRIANIGTAWPRMRTGTTRSVVYVAPRMKGTRGRGDPRRRRPNLATLLMGRAMEPALRRNEARVEREIERLVDRAIDRFNAGGF